MVVGNKTYILDITDQTHEGQGVGRVDGFAVFVGGAIAGERVKVKIDEVRKTYAVGTLVAVLDPSPCRTAPFCDAYQNCGGCNLQHMSHSAQLDLKTKLVKDNLARLGGLEDIIVHDAIGMDNPRTYRNKAQYPVGTVDGQIKTGFYASRTHKIVTSDVCGIQDAVSERVWETVARFLGEKNVTAKDICPASVLRLP